jgi:hypothetical protein
MDLDVVAEDGGSVVESCFDSADFSYR